jgi:hypothetical protein
MSLICLLTQLGGPGYLEMVPATRLQSARVLFPVLVSDETGRGTLH